MRFEHVIVLLVIALLGAPARSEDNTAKPDRFAPLRFVAGTWRGDQTCQPGATPERTYEFILNERFLQDTNTSTCPNRRRTRTEKSTIT